MIFIETSLFTNLLPRYLNDDEYAALQWYLLERPIQVILFAAAVGSEKFAGHCLAKVRAMVFE